MAVCVTTRVLVVDDEEAICALFADMLREHGGYDVVTTTNGLEVLEILRRDPFDVVLLDMSMPAVSGLDVLREITQTFEELPVIIVTGHASIEVAVESMQAGAADFVTKPVPAAVLHLRIQSVLEHVRIRRLATTDGLTALHNYRTFQERLAQEVARAERYARPLSLLMIDVDGFKAYNDANGHPRANLVLQELARLLGEMSRISDTVARCGGDEFAVILPETDNVSARSIAERLRVQVEGHLFPGEERVPRGTLTISIGVGSHVSGGTKDTLLQAADAALYAAKRGGRNRVCSEE
jgi:two-component system cell cycle response regulator